MNTYEIRDKDGAVIGTVTGTTLAIVDGRAIVYSDVGHIVGVLASHFTVTLKRDQS